MMLANKTLFLALFSLSKIPMHSLPRLSCFEFAYAFVSSSNILFIMSWSKLLHCYPARTNTAQWHRKKKELEPVIVKVLFKNPCASSKTIVQHQGYTLQNCSSLQNYCPFCLEKSIHFDSIVCIASSCHIYEQRKQSEIRQSISSTMTIRKA